MSENPGSLAEADGGAVQVAREDACRRVAGVRKSFGSVQAVRGVALAVGSGEVMAFLGPNGAGKTSTIDMVLSLSRPDAGAGPDDHLRHALPGGSRRLR